MKTFNKLKTVNLNIKGQSEREFEHTIVAHLQSSKEIALNLITQIDIDEVEKITKSNLFGFTYRPDMSIGNSGTAIEVKIIDSGQRIRDILGQAIAYRMHYRFVILVLIDQTADSKVVETCGLKNSQECNLLFGIAENMNVFTIIGPVSKSENLCFLCEG